MTLDEYNSTREEWGKSLYRNVCARKLLGFFSPPWDELPEETKESYRHGAIVEGVGLLANQMREFKPQTQ